MKIKDGWVKRGNIGQVYFNEITGTHIFLEKKVEGKVIGQEWVSSIEWFVKTWRPKKGDIPQQGISPKTVLKVLDKKQAIKFINNYIRKYR